MPLHPVCKILMCGCIHLGKLKGGFQYCEYVSLYDDDVLAISKKPKDIIDNLRKVYQIKSESIGASTYYLGSEIKQ